MEERLIYADNLQQKAQTSAPGDALGLWPP